jgi:hypothetical protein
MVYEILAGPHEAPAHVHDGPRAERAAAGFAGALKQLGVSVVSLSECFPPSYRNTKSSMGADGKRLTNTHETHFVASTSRHF